MKTIANYLNLLAAVALACLSFAPANGQVLMHRRKAFQAPAGGPDTWYNVEISANVDASAFSSAGTDIVSAAVTVGSAGNATKVRVFLGTSNFGTDTLKMALYDSGGNWLSSGSVAAPASTSVYVECNITSVAVTATTYYIAVQGSNGNHSWGYKSGVGTHYVHTSAYASFPLDPLTFGSSFTGNYALSVYVD